MSATTPVRCFLIERTDRLELGLRRYRSGSTCTERGYHNAVTMLGTLARPLGSDGVESPPPPSAYEGHPRWPTTCACGYRFADDDTWQVWTARLWRRADTGEEFTLRDAPPGAMWDAYWMPAPWRGPDGRSLHVICPDGSDWAIDGHASNCTMPDDRVHHCWIRHGEPPAITVDKQGGPTCEAGAGSIATEGYHGFLVDGVFT